MKNFTNFKGRTLNKDKKVRVFFNLHLHKFSIEQSGLIVGHADEVNLKDVTYKVYEKGRQKVLLEKRKNVHAYVIGHVHDEDNATEQAYYNPYKVKTFVTMDGKELHESKFATLKNKQVLYR